MNDRAGHVLRICERAAELANGEREAYLSEICEGDSALRAEVDGQLREWRAAATKRIEPAAVELLPLPAEASPGAPRLGGRFGNYEVVSKIGEGAMGTVYRLRHQFFDRGAALKVLRPHLSGDGMLVRRFLNEARAANAIKHPNIIEIVDAGLLSNGGAPYLLMELLEGESLRNRMRRLGRITLASALHITRQVASALTATHEQGIIHRDLKPENLFLINRDGRDDAVKVLDFGVAKLGAELAGRDVPTQPGVVVGTPRYMSPEQCRGVAAVDQRADIYALGVILYEMLAGEPPFEANAVGALLEMQLLRDPVSLREHAPATPANVVAAVMRAIARQPEDRFGSMRELAALLDSAATAADATAPAPPANSSSSSTNARADETASAAAPETDSLEPAPLARDKRDERTSKRSRTLALSAVGAAAIVALGFGLVPRKETPPPTVAPTADLASTRPPVSPAPAHARATAAQSVPAQTAPAPPESRAAEVGPRSPASAKKRPRPRKTKYVPPLWW